MAYIINIGIPTLFVTMALWFLYFIVHMCRSVNPMDVSERMFRFGATVMGVVVWLYIVASALTNYTPLVAPLAVLLGTVLPMAYVALNKEEVIEQEDEEAPAN